MMMAKYRKRPVIIEAIQLRWDTWNEVCAFIGDESFAEGADGCYVTESGEHVDSYPGPDSRIGLRIPTSEGVMLATENDWIIRGIKGELYPCKPDIFEATYVPMVDT